MSIWNEDADLTGTDSSDIWQLACKVKVLDPDGWDRKNFQYSWYEEQITAQEFEARMMGSTVNTIGLYW